MIRYATGEVVDENRREVVIDLVPPVFSSVVAGVRYDSKNERIACRRVAYEIDWKARAFRKLAG